MPTIWDNKIKEAKINYDIAIKELELAEKEAKTKKGISGLEIYLGYNFESSTGLTPEFNDFQKAIKKYIVNVLDKNLELVEYSCGHFYFSGFITNKLTEKYAYFSASDVRYFPNGWYNNLLIRTAKHIKDYTGGSNDWCRLPEISQKALLLTL